MRLIIFMYEQASAHFSGVMNWETSSSRISTLEKQSSSGSYKRPSNIPSAVFLQYGILNLISKSRHSRDLDGSKEDNIPLSNFDVGW